MKTKLLLFIIIFPGSVLYAQQPTITSNISALQLVCPGSSVDYTINYPTNYIGCQVNWTIKSGEGNFATGSGFSSTSNPTRITWQDSKPNKVEVEVTVKFRPTSGGSCSTPEETVLSFTHILRSVFQESFTNVGSPVNIPYCASQPVVTLGVNTMHIKNTGGQDQPPLTEVERYQWILPAGWRQVGTGNTGTIHTTISTIQVEPSNAAGNCTSGGEVKVHGIAGGATQCIGLPFSLSKQATIVLNRTPEFTLNPPSGYTGQQCGNRNPVVFTATALSCVSTYNWTYPQGWSGPAQTSTNSVSVTPADTGGDVTVTVNTGTCTISKSYTVSYFNDPLGMPYFTQNDIYVLCSQSSATASIHSITDAASYIWYTDTWDSNPTGPVYLNSSSHSHSNPLTTSTPSISISTPSVTSSYGVTLYVRAERANPNCAGSPTSYTRIWAGKPAQVLMPDTYIGPEYAKCVAHNTFADFSADAYSIPGATDVKWRTFPQHSGISLSWLYTGGSINTTLYASNSVPTGCYDLIVEAENVCGKADGGAMTNIEIRTPSSSCSGCGGWMMMSIYPNPANDYMEVELTGEGCDEDELDFEYNIEIIDGTGFQRKTLTTNKRLTQIPTSDFSKGIYYIKAYMKDKKVEKRMIIE
jgi:hypothetical protein